MASKWFPLNFFALNVKKIVLSVIFFFAHCTFVYSDLYFDYYYTDQGMSNGGVVEFTQGKQGYLWVATANGLNRYNGYEFKLFQNDSQISETLVDNYLYSIYQDTNNNIWIGTHSHGLNQFNLITGKITRFPHSKNSPHHTLHGQINDIIEDKDNNIWVASNGGLSRYSPRTKQFQHFIHQANNPSTLSSDEALSLAIQNSNDLWVGTSHGLNKFDLSTGKVIKQYFHEPNNPLSLSNSTIVKLYTNKKGDLWLITDKYLERYDETSDGFIHYMRDVNADSFFMNDIAQDQEGNLWIATTKGLFKLNTQTGHIDHYKADKYLNNALKDNNIDSVYVDRSNQLWIGLHYGGVQKANLDAQQFNWQRHHLNDSSSLSDEYIRVVYENRPGIIWIITNDYNLNKLNLETHKVTRFSSKLLSSDGKITPLLSHITGDGKDVLWIATENDGLKTFNTRTNEIHHYIRKDDNINGVVEREILEVYYDSKKRLWIRTADDLFYILSQQNQRINLPESSNSNVFNQIGARLIQEDTLGNIWLGTDRGIYRYNEKTHNFEAFNKDNTKMTSHTIRSYLPDDNQIFWLGTNQGLSSLDLKTKEIKIYNMDNGLSSDHINGILKDKSGMLWISSDNGLNRFNPVTEEFTQFYARDGLQNNEFNYPYAALNSKIDLMVFGGIGGINYFNPLKIKKNIISPDAVITKFKINNKTVEIGGTIAKGVLDKYISYMDRIQLPYKKNTFSLEISTLDFKHTKSNQYAFRMLGLNSDWQYRASSQRLIEFTDLSPGNYIFQYKGSNSDGFWSREQQLAINISYPWWRSGCAYLCYLLIVSLLIASIIWLRTAQLQKRAAKLEQMVHQRTFEISEKNRAIEQLLEEKDRLFTHISHEFRTPLTLILGPVKKILGSIINQFQKDQLNIIQRSTYRLLRLVDQLLELSRLQQQQRNKCLPEPADTVDIDKLSKTVIDSFIPVAEEKHIKLIAEINSQTILNCKYDVYEGILLNLLSNGIKYTMENGCVWVRVYKHKSASKICLEVEDNGIGIPEDYQHVVFKPFMRVESGNDISMPGTGIGLSLVKELVDNFQGQISFVSEQGKGTLFRVLLPGVITEDILQKKQQLDLISDQKATPALDSLSLEIMNLSEQIKQDDNQLEEKMNVVENSDDKKASLLIIEDNPDMREHIKGIFNDEYHCVTAKDGVIGVDQAKETVPDIIISDIMMPDKSGYDVCQLLKNEETTSHIPIIILTALTERDSRLRGFREKADDYMTKPFDAEELKIRVNNLLEIRNILRQRFAVEKNNTRGNPVELHHERNKSNPIDNRFIEKFNACCEKYYRDSTLSVKQLAMYMALTDRQLGRKLQAITGLKPTEYLKNYRLDKACQLLAEGVPIKVVAEQTGFSERNYFANIFKARFKITPRQYQDNYKPVNKNNEEKQITVTEKT